MQEDPHANRLVNKACFVFLGVNGESLLIGVADSDKIQIEMVKDGLDELFSLRGYAIDCVPHAFTESSLGIGQAAT